MAGGQLEPLFNDNCRFEEEKYEKYTENDEQWRAQKGRTSNNGSQMNY